MRVFVCVCVWCVSMDACKCVCRHTPALMARFVCRNPCVVFFQLQIIFFQILKYFYTVHIPLTKIVKSAAFFSLS